MTVEVFNTNKDLKAIPPIKIAFIIDGEVVDILHTDSRLAAIFLSEPTIVDVTDEINSGTEIGVGSLYSNGVFSAPEKE